MREDGVASFSAPASDVNGGDDLAMVGLRPLMARTSGRSDISPAILG